MATKYSLLPNDTTKEVLPTSSLLLKPSPSSLKVKKYVYLLILFKMLVVIYIFSPLMFTDDCRKGYCIDDALIIPKPLPKESEKFMTYLPHSGLHNQRIALENAVYLAWVLNRTLIVPPL